MSETNTTATPNPAAPSTEHSPELSLQEIAALLHGRLPASKARPCLDQIPFLPVRNRASAN
ncbi:MAG: hypothetical protein KTR19_13380 [Hyphomicrobiales bacterium]|nr:hypothetical protein [Hyphomicrobiales bacterium]